MTAFESPRWSELKHAYGDAADVPELLDELCNGGAEAIGDLWSRLCHQGTVYSASYAALPRLADTAWRTPDVVLRTQILVLIGSIAASTDRAPMPDDLREEYQGAMPRALELALKTLNEALDPDDAVYLLEAAASLDGRAGIGRVLSGFVEDEFMVECPNCDRDLYLWPEEGHLTAAAEDPVVAPETPRTPIVPGPEPSHEGDYSWLLRVGGDAALSQIGGRLASLFGRGTCPACGGAFSVMNQLAGTR
jgi:hypothetical protein